MATMMSIKANAADKPVPRRFPMYGNDGQRVGVLTLTLKAAALEPSHVRWRGRTFCLNAGGLRRAAGRVVGYRYVEWNTTTPPSHHDLVVDDLVDTTASLDPDAISPTS